MTSSKLLLYYVLPLTLILHIVCVFLFRHIGKDCHSLVALLCDS
jgi:hypothetical protein